MGTERQRVFALIYLVDQEGSRARLAGASGFGSGKRPLKVDPAKPESGICGWPVTEAGRTAPVVAVRELATRFGIAFGRHWPEPPLDAMLLPIGASNGGAIAGILVGGQIAAAIGNARAYEEQRAEPCFLPT